MPLIEFNFANILRMSQLAHDRAKEFNKKRYLYKDIVSSAILGKDKITGIIGQRGVGKTVLLLQLLNEFDVVYLSLDIFNMRTIDIGTFVSVIEAIIQKGKQKVLLIDEIHYYKDYSALLKLFYDTTDIKVIFTSSVSIIMSNLKQDLSRRVQLKYLYPFDYKEFLYFSKNINIDYLSWDDLLNDKIDINYFTLGNFFKEYLTGGIFPFYNIVEDFKDRLTNILERIIREDIARIANIAMNDIHNIEDMLKFIGKSDIDGISFSSLSNNLSLNVYKVKQYVQLLENAFVLNVIYPKGTNVKKEPKILFTPPFRLLYREYDDSIGGLREDFAVQMMKQNGFKIYYLKSSKGKKRPDYLIEWKENNIVVEIGGKGKGFSQFKGITEEYKKIVFKDNYLSNKRGEYFPLYIMGLLKS